MFYIVISIIAGFSIVIARVINSNLADRIGTLQGTFINYAVGLFFSIIFLLISEETLYIYNEAFHSLPLWAYFGGLAGVLVIVLSNYSTPKISAFYLTIFTFLGQLFVGVILDYFTINQLSTGKIVGGILVLCGLTYNLFVDKKYSIGH